MAMKLFVQYLVISSSKQKFSSFLIYVYLEMSVSAFT